MPVSEPAECSICTCEIEAGDVRIFCSATKEGEAHFIDAPCFAHLLGTVKSDTAALHFWKEHQRLRCPLGCGGSFDPEQVWRCGDAELIRAYVGATQAIACSIERLDAQHQAEKAAIENSAESKGNLVRCMLAEVDVVMTAAISCPLCQTPFFDFSGCLSLTCEKCKREFCGVCLKKGSHASGADGHAQVAECTQRRLTEEQRKSFDFHSIYFISAPGWERWKEKIKVDALYDYLRSLRLELVWESWHLIDQKLTKDKLLARASIDQLRQMVFSHKHGENLHLVRLPNTFWLVYSAKKNVRFVDAVQRVGLSSDELKSMGLVVVDRIRRAYPNWEAVRKQVPGEAFMSINYPVECLPLIAEAIAEWGKGRYW